ncbi:MAG: MFS transporter [Deltaproteobacteria bacterium]|jgi:predicted MFS family arabinose efflux permease|nr:MFS transporter [Deltaproteobacteria bacterium]
MNQAISNTFFSRRLALGCVLGLLACFALYDLLLYSGLRREARDQALSIAAVSASALNMKISAGLRLGKELDRFAGLDRVLAQAGTALPQGGGIAVLLPDGRIASLWGELREKGDGLLVSAPIADRLETEVGRTLVSLPEEYARQGIAPGMRGLILLQAALALLFFLFLYRGAASRFPALNRKKLMLSGLGLILLPLLVSMLFSLRVYLEQRETAAGASALHIERILSEDLNKLLLVGVSLGGTRGLEQYLQKMSAHAPDNSVALRVLDESGRSISSSHAPGTPLAGHLSFRLPLSSGRAATGMEQQGNASLWQVEVGLTRSSWQESITSLVLNVLTMLVIALTLMLEVFLLLFHFAAGDTENAAQGQRHSALLLRALLFVFALSKDLSVSFIPLRMGELAADSGIKPLLMSLPVSAEIVAAACGIMLAGVWMRQRGPAPAMTCGALLALLGNLAAAFAAWPWMFVLARSLAGAGYGLFLLPAQAVSVKEGKLAFLFAGVYAGFLCGSAMGAMLADYMGYAAVFMLSALIILPLLPLPRLLFGGSAPTQDRQQAAPAHMPLLRGLAALLRSPAFLTLLCFSLIPAAFLDIGLMNYFLPVFLHASGADQSDIGRVFMLYCLALICLGPQVEKIINAHKAERAAVFSGMLFCAAGAAAFTALPPLAASFTGAFCLGLACCCNIPGQSAFLLRLKVTSDLGVELSMSALNTVERAGQMIGPLCIGAFFAAAGASTLIMGGVAAALLAGGAAFMAATRHRAY